MKSLQIAWKDTLTRFRDWKALVGLLGAPLIISTLIGLAFGNIGGLGGTEAPISNIEMILVNQDAGDLGANYEEVLTSEGLQDLLNVRQMNDLEAARAEIEAGNARGVLFIPAGFSDALIPEEGSTGEEAMSGSVELYLDPAANISPFIIQSIVEQITAGANTILLAAGVTADQIVEQAELLGPAMENLAPVLTAELQPENFDFSSQKLTLNKIEVGEARESFSPFAFFIPGMAVFFLMFSMFDGSRSILLEESRGTLPRLMTTPTPIWQIILGKMGGTFMTGLLQFTILVIASTLIFGISWGSSIPGLITVVVLTVFAASGLGALLTVFARNETQASIVGSAVSLVFGALGGSFFPAENFSGVINVISKFTLNRWAMQGLTTLTIRQGGFNDILLEAGILGAIGLVTFSLALWAFQRRFVK
ncbi:MAG: ABC transporter permease [Chloroflexi bacterium]|nr:ABC transporter permease [Chloroflexota bacterium]MQC25938.1 ABC transporter permease [Chloroflexota bacterium]